MNSLDFINYLVSKPKAKLLLVFIFVGLFFPGLLQLRIENDILAAYLGEENSTYLQYIELRDQFSDNAPLLIAVASQGKGVFDRAYLKLIENTSQSLFEIAGVSKVVSLSSVVITHSSGNHIVTENLLGTEVISNEMKQHRAVASLISRDKKSSLLMVFLAQENIAHGESIISEIDSRLSLIPYHMVGLSVIQDEIKHLIAQTLRYIAPLAFIIMLLLLWYFTGSITFASLPILVTLLSIFVTLGIAGYLDFPLTGLSMGVPQVLLAIGVCDGLHLISTYRQMPTNLKLSLERNMAPTLLTSVTTALSFFSFSFSSIQAVAQFGILCGIGSLIAWGLSYFIIGPMLAMLGPLNKKFQSLTEFGKIQKANKPNKINQGNKVNKAGRLDLYSSPWPERALVALTQFRRPILCVFASLSLAGLFLSSQLKLGLDVSQSFSESSRLGTSLKFFNEKFGIASVRHYFINCKAPDCTSSPSFLRELVNLHGKLQSQPGVEVIHSQLDAITMAGESLFGSQFAWEAEQLNEIDVLAEIQGAGVNTFVSHKKDISKLSIYLNTSNLAWGREFDQNVKHLAGSFDLKASSTGSILGAIEGTMLPQIGISVAFTVFAIGFIFFLFFKQMKTVVLSLMPNLVTLTLVSLLFYLADISLSLNTMVVWSVCMGVAVDDTIHFLYHYFNGVSRGLSIRASIKEVYVKIGHALISTSVVLSVAFATSLLGGYRPGREAGLILSVTVIVALIVDLILLPAFLLSFEKSSKESR